MKKRLKTLLTASLLLSGSAFADSEHQSLLERISKKIHLIQSSLSEEQKEQSRLQTTLKELDLEIGQSVANLHQYDKQIKAYQGKIASLEKQKDSYQEKIETHKSVLADQFKVAYLFSRTPTIKFLLNEQNPSDIARLLAYYRFISQAQFEAIDELKTTIRNIQTMSEEINKQSAALEALREEQKTQAKALAEQKNKQNQVISTIKKKINTHQQELENLEQQREKLNEVIRNLKPAPALPAATIDTRKGIWPVDQKYLSHPRRYLDGVLISAPENTPIHSIYAGQIVFADWLRGFGLLIIIDHGRGLMTLYGRCNSLYRKVGDKVNAGETIASVGQSGGYDTPALFFELRRDGKSVPTTQWFK